jgi:hypothetical protein
MCELNNFKNKVENTLCKIHNNTQKITYGVSNTAGAVGNTLDGMIRLITSGDITVKFIEQLTNFVTQTGVRMINIIGNSMTRFATWCHQNYELSPNIMVARWPNDYSDNICNTIAGIGNLRRRPNGLCAELSKCSLASKTIIVPKKVPVDFKLYSLKNSRFNITNPFPKKNNHIFSIIVVVSIILIIALWIFLIYTHYKNKK